MNPHDEPVLPPPPERPDCCAGSCAVCVLEGYAEELERWHAECERLRAEHRAHRPPAPPLP
ncbi:MAG: oxidoreductase-like domain-containing protein [Gammaproteobacteria bacterium]|jgi:hypothetical protein